MQLKRAANIFVINIFVFLLAVSFCASAYAEDAKQAAGTQGNAARAQYGSKDGLRSNLVNPIISNNTPLNTLDKSKSGNAQLVCPSSKRYLDVFVQPSGSGDLQRVIVNMDTNMDGNTDYAYQVPFAVSGVCANGLLACNPGTWENCTYYKWVADDSYKVILQQQPNMDTLGGCYCINSSCGSNLVFNNIAMVLKDIGGGAAGAVSAKNPKFTVSNVQVDGTSIIYYGQDTANCSVVGSSYGSASPDKYYKNYAALNADTESQVISQAADPNSYYNLLKNSMAWQRNQAGLSNCNINRTLSCIPDTTGYVVNTNNQCIAMESDPKCKIKAEVVDAVETYNEYNPTMITPGPVCQSITCQKQATCNNNLVFDTGPLDANTGNCGAVGMGRSSMYGEWPCVGQEGVSCDLTARTCSVSGISDVMTTFICRQTDGDPFNPKCLSGICKGNLMSPCYPNSMPSEWQCMSGYMGGTDNTQYICTRAVCNPTPPGQVYSAYVPAGNAFAPSAKMYTYSARGQCAMSWYIGIWNSAGRLVAYTNGSTTNCGQLDKPLAYQAPYTDTYTAKIWMQTAGYYGGENCQGTVNQVTCPLEPNLPCSGSVSGSSVCTQAQTHRVCDWWAKQRTYLCDTGQKFDFSDIQKRVQRINSTTKDNTSSFYYQDLRKDDNGNWVTDDVTTNLPARDAYGPCEQACKTKKTCENTQAGAAGTTAGFKSSVGGFNFFYKVCVDNTCPLDAGEVIVKACQCINEFAEAAVIMQTVRQAGQDIICSSGASKPLQ